MNYGDAEDSFLSLYAEEFSYDADHWRWCEHLSVVEA